MKINKIQKQYIFYFQYRHWVQKENSLTEFSFFLAIIQYYIVPPKKFGGMVSVKDDLNLAVSLKVKD